MTDSSSLYIAGPSTLGQHYVAIISFSLSNIQHLKERRQRTSQLGVLCIPLSTSFAIRQIRLARKDKYKGGNYALGGPFIHAERFGDLLYSDPTAPADYHTYKLQQVLYLLERHGAHPRQFLTYCLGYNPREDDSS